MSRACPAWERRHRGAWPSLSPPGVRAGDGWGQGCGDAETWARVLALPQVWAISGSHLAF